MKFKFAPQVTEIINAIAALPDEPAEMTRKVLYQPRELISRFDDWLREHKNDKKFAGKEWAKLRRQLSFLYEAYLLAVSKAPKIADQSSLVHDGVTPQPNDDFIYREMVKYFKDIHSGRALQTVAGVQIGMKYGVVHLSDHEIQGLIDRNKL